MKNTYEHISFKPVWEINEPVSNLLGQCYAYIQAIKKTPIRPDYLRQLLRVFLNKGALATTAIEGNTLSERELESIQGGMDLPPSKKYLQQEVENILDAFNTIFEDLSNPVLETKAAVSAGLIKNFHAMVGKDIGEAFAATPGVFRTNNVVVGSLYRPPSFPQVENMIEKLCTWLKTQFHYQPGQRFNEALIQAIVTHVYIAWIHPFSDGNGRTARLLEFYLLLRAGVPQIASHILSNHYNETRTDYYRRLQEATETGNLTNFFLYALVGFRDGLEGVLEVIHKNQIDLTWSNYVHDTIESLSDEKNEKVLERLRQLAYYIPGDKYLSFDEIKTVHPKVIRHYQKLSAMTLQRDLDILINLNLLTQEKKKFRTQKETLQMFIPASVAEIQQSY
ncbi:MAG: Fic family protein [Treponema sp.]|jgi:Fic family protein|nr:Fic family protein [Treponema sp.]